MKNGPKTCPECGTKFFFVDYQAVEIEPADELCLGCERLIPIYEESARIKAAQREQASAAPAGGFTSVADIQRRLMAGRQQPLPERDWARDAAGDRD